MCKETTTTYTHCTCRVPSVEHCPRYQIKAGYKNCVDFCAEEEEQKGICVGVGTCIAEAEVGSRGSSSEGKQDDDDMGLGAVIWGEVFGLFVR